MRLFAALLVVCIHSWQYDGRDYILPLTRIAVPIFFLITGFFLYSNDVEKSYERIRHSLKKISLLWLFGTLIYCVEAYYRCKVTGDFSRLTPSPSMPFLWIVFCHQKIGFHLWFLVGMCQGLLAMWLSIRKQWTQRIPLFHQWLIPCILITIGTLLNKYLCDRYPILGNKDLLYPPVLFMCWPFLQLGYCLHKHRDLLIIKFTQCEIWLWLTVGISTVLSIIEGQYAPSCGDNYLMTLPLVLSVFILLLLHPSFGTGFIALLGQRYALWIYILHVLVYRCISFHLHSYSHWILHPLSIFVISFVLSLLVERVYRFLVTRGTKSKQVTSTKL